MGKYEKQRMGQNMGLWKFKVRNGIIKHIYTCVKYTNPKGVGVSATRRKYEIQKPHRTMCRREYC